MRKALSICMALTLGLALALPAAAADKRISIGTAGTAGALYPMGVAMAETINRHVPGFKASAEASSASLENLRNLAQGNVDWAISQNEVAFLAYNGEGKYKGRAVSSLRSLFGTLLSWAQIFTSADSKINSVKDFKGKRIGVGAPGSGGERAAQKILSYYGLTYKDIKPEFMSNAEMVAALKDGTLDAFIITHPLKSAALLDLTTSYKVKMVPVADDGFYKKYPYFNKLDVPAGTYRNVDKPTPTPTSRVVMYTSTKANLSADAVYAMLKGLWANTGEWTNTHPAVKKYTTLQDAVKGLQVPLHPGAVKFYKEKGLDVPAKLIK
ncbi:MAG: TAXI family TRAP transporter solute-binding subunit [Desulfarculus sp.]|nr:TAXI family TRAP transporter solute-binding subunit [Pseudomonadota bacterium]MBV1715624.1 TAXI family TRAP transporter solute-binding subunit [Desulfarculus sp.]MBU4576472.1 TAXI family TRAP transporter solute-binding subunit [Pseudomonadota bacterium]MBU4600132.1 TAXI family TRAP transporter solute-binding subunit [Pseudomonadota bacterium]MBV1738844.1 TAXI family TRAP transporter solute-binding subunit [Desulfarculus sp.]